MCYGIAIESPHLFFEGADLWWLAKTLLQTDWSRRLEKEDAGIHPRFLRLGGSLDW